MTGRLNIIAIITVFSLLWISSEAFSYYDKWSVPSWMDPFADPRPVYKYDWAFGTGGAGTDNNGVWYNTGLYPNVGKSRGDGTVYSDQGSCYWMAPGGRLNGFSVSNSIGDWLDAIGTGQAVIRFAIRQNYGASINNSDIVEISDNEVENIVKHGHGVDDSLGLNPGDNITALEWNVNFDDEDMIYDHVNSIEHESYRASVGVTRNQDDENVYMTWGAEAEIDNDLTGTTRAGKDWPDGNYKYGMAHHADICYEIRTYDPYRNSDGPESPYEWLYDASGDMYEPTDGSGSPTDTPLERGYKLVNCHPAFPDDDHWEERETWPPDDDYGIWGNREANYGSTSEGALVRGVFVDSWRLAGEMLGTEFWNDDPDYVWDPDDGRVEDENDDAVAGYDALNNFMRYVFDIDALVVEDNGVEGEFGSGDYVLFSVVDDSLYSLYEQWGSGVGDDDNVDAFFSGQYFDGDTIFLYDGTSVTTFFDAEAGIFFGEAIDTSTGYGSAQTLWAMGPGIIDLEALDIGIIPEPSTILLMIGSASGLAVVAGIMRRKMR